LKSNSNVDEDELDYLIQRRLDPVLNFTPWPTQHRCYVSKARYRWIGGANRKGKSALLGVEAASAARRLHPTRTVSKPTTGLILAPSREQLQDPWEKKLLKDCELRGFEGRPFIPAQEIAKVWYTHGAGAPTLKQIDMKNGNTIRFGVSKDPESWKRRAGQALSWIILDEAEGDLNLLNELYPRLLDANKDEQIVREAGGGWLLWGATPTTANVALMRFIQTCEDPKEPDWEGFRMGEADGDAADKRERERLRGAFSDEDFDLRMLGTVDYADRLLIYGKHWDDQRVMIAPDYEVHPDDNLWCAYDPGGAGQESHDTGILFAAISKDQPTLIKVVHFIRMNRTILSYDFKRIAHYLRGRTLEGFIPDIASNKTEKTTGKSLSWQMKEEMARQEIKSYRGIILPYNRHEPGIRRVQTYLDDGLIKINASKASGGQLLRQQMLSYRSYEEGVYQGARGVVKKDDEGPDCLVSGTLIETATGPRPIEDIAVGDMVLTRKGYRRVTDAWRSTAPKPVFTVETSNGHAVTATAGHRFWTENRGWARLDSLRYSDIVATCLTSSYSRGESTTSTAAPMLGTSETAEESCCIGQYGNQHTDQSRKAARFTTETGIAGTTLSTISKPSPPQSTAACTVEANSTTWMPSGGWQSLGIDHPKAGRGTSSIARTFGRSAQRVNTSASDAGSRSRPGTGSRSSVRDIASPERAIFRASTMSQQPVLSAGRRSRRTSTCESSPVPASVRLVAPSGSAHVHDLTVEGEHEFFANGVLVHNCLRYLCMGLNGGRTRLVYVPRGCGKPGWLTPEKPPPPVPPPVEALTQDQENYQLQLIRSARLTSAIFSKRRIRN
jgi:hypothetical protein